MRRALSLSFLSCLGAPPEEAARAAAGAGYDFVGFRMLPAAPGGLAFPLMDDPARLRSVKSLLGELGLGVFDVEMIRIAETFDAATCEPFLACSAELGARAILIAGDDTDEARLTAHFVQLCEVAAPYGLSMDLEFMPQSEVKDVRAARRILEAAGQPNQGIIVDALHVSRSRSTLPDIAALPPQWLHYAQICDGPAAIPDTREALNFAARHERLLPGEGALDLVSLFDALPAELPVAAEVPNDRLSDGLTPLEWAKRCRASTLATLEKAGAVAG